MSRIRVRPRSGYCDSRETSFESMGGSESAAPTVNSSKLTVDTSSLTSSDETSAWNSPSLPIEDELVILRRRVKNYEQREVQMHNNIARVQDELEMSKKSAYRWKQAVDGDVRPGSHYRKEIATLKEELDKQHDTIQDREITIENLMTKNHPSHSILDTSDFSSLLDEAPDEMQRLVLENQLFSRQLRKQEEQLHQLKRILVEREKGTMDSVKTNNETGNYSDRVVSFQPDCREFGRTNKVMTSNRESEFLNSFSLEPFDPFQPVDGQQSIASQSSDRSDSIRMTKRVMELHNQLNKTAKERDSLRQELQRIECESNRLHNNINQNDGAPITQGRSSINKKNLRTEVGVMEFHEIGKNKQEIRELKHALQESLVELEAAAEVMTDQRNNMKDLKKQSTAKEKTLVQLQAALQAERKNLEVAKKNLMERDAKIEDLSLFANHVESVKKRNKSMGNELQHLHQSITSWEDKCDTLQKELLKKETEVDGLKLSIIKERATQIQLKDDGGHISTSLKEENKMLIEKTNHQNIQLQKADKILFEKDIEQKKLKTSLKEVQSKLFSIEAEKYDLSPDKGREMKPNDFGKKSSERSEANEILERKCQALEKNIKFYTDETLRLHEDLIGKNCDFKPFEKYLKMLLFMKACDDSDLVRLNTEIVELDRIRFEFLNELNRLLEELRECSKKTDRLEKSLDEKDIELEKLREIKQEHQSLKNTRQSKTELYHTERKEKEMIACHRDDLISQLKVLNGDMKEMEEKNELLEKKLILQASSLQMLSDETKGKDAKIADLGKNVVLGNDLITRNLELKKKNVYLLERVDELSLEVEELNQSPTIQSKENMSLEALKSQLEQTKTSYERQISALVMNKDFSIDTLRKDLATSRSRNAEEVARLTDELSKLQSSHTDFQKCFGPDAIRQKDQRICTLERVLHAQEQTIDSLRSELDQVQLSMRDVSEQRRKDLEELQKELIESKSSAMNQGRKYISLKSEIDEWKIRYEKETEILSGEIERLRKDSPSSNDAKDSQETRTMLEAKQRLDQLRVVNIELKKDNLKLSADLERALLKIESIEEENELTTELEKECSSLRRQLKDLERSLESIREAKDKSRQIHTKSEGNPELITVNQTEEKKTKKGKRKKFAGWGKSATA